MHRCTVRQDCTHSSKDLEMRFFTPTCNPLAVFRSFFYILFTKLPTPTCKKRERILLASMLKQSVFKSAKISQIVAQQNKSQCNAQFVDSAA